MLGRKCLLRFKSMHLLTPLSLSEILLLLVLMAYFCTLFVLYQRQQLLSTQKQEAEQQAQQAHNSFQEIKLALSEADSELQAYAVSAERNATQNGMLLGQLEELQAEKETLQQRVEQQQQRYQSAQLEWQTQRTRFEAQQDSLNEKIVMLEDSEARLERTFEQLSHKVFEDRNQLASEQSKAQLTALLQPFREQLDGFRQLVHSNQKEESTQRALLKSELERLNQLNRQISDDANRLTDALKGDTKLQGNWGEMILQTLLEQSGLRKDHEFLVQTSYTTETGKRYQPDVVVRLPNQRSIIIDSKVSLVAYERFFNAEREEDKGKWLKAHIQSIRGHIKGLSRKAYEKLPQLDTPDYVLLFIPIEAAFSCAVSAQPELIDEGMQSNTLLVSPTNLMVALRTIHNLWQVDYQNQYAAEIAARAGKLYDKFSGFVGDLESAGESLVQAHEKYNAAMGKLATGRGSLLSQVKMMEQLQIKHQKQLPEQLNLRSLDKDETC